MHKIIIPIFLLLVFLSACSSDSEKATNLIHKANLLLNEKGLQEPQKAIDYLTKAIYHSAMKGKYCASMKPSVMFWRFGELNQT